MTGHEPSDVEIARHLECQGKSNDVSLINLGDYYKSDVLAHNGFWIIESTNVNRYHWIAGEVVGTPSVLNIVEAITEVDITVGNPSDWLILPLSPGERIYHSFEGCSVPL